MDEFGKGHDASILEFLKEKEGFKEPPKLIAIEKPPDESDKWKKFRNIPDDEPLIPLSGNF